MSLDSDYYIPEGDQEVEDEDHDFMNIYEQTTADMKRQWDVLHERAKLLDDDRRRFTEAAIMLGMERANLAVRAGCGLTCRGNG